MQGKWDEMFGKMEKEAVEEVNVRKPRKKAVAKKVAQKKAVKPAVKIAVKRINIKASSKKKTTKSK